MALITLTLGLCKGQAATPTVKVFPGRKLVLGAVTGQAVSTITGPRVKRDLSTMRGAITGQAVTTLTYGHKLKVTVAGQATTSYAGQVWTDVPMGAVTGRAVATGKVFPGVYSALSAAGAATTTVTLSKIGSNPRFITASAAGSATASNSPAVLTGVAMGNVAGQATTTVTGPQVKRNLGSVRGPIAGQAVTTATVFPGRYLTVSAAGAAITTANLTKVGANLRFITVSAAGAATTTVTGPQVKRNLGSVRGAITGQAITTASVFPGRYLGTLTSAGTSTTVANLVVKRSLSVSAAGVATTSGLIQALNQFTMGSIAGQATTTANLTKVGSGLHNVTASATGAGTATVALAVKHALTLAVAGQATTTASMAVKHSLTATITGQATVTDTVNVKRKLTLAIAGQGTASVTMGKIGFSTANASGQGATVVTLQIKRALVASAAGQAVTATPMVRVRFLTVGTVTGSSATIANGPQMKRALLAIAAGLSGQTVTENTFRKPLISLGGVASVTTSLGILAKTTTATRHGIYKQEHDIALADLGADRGLKARWRSALKYLGDKGQ